MLIISDWLFLLASGMNKLPEPRMVGHPIDIKLHDVGAMILCTLNSGQVDRC